MQRKRTKACAVGFYIYSYETDNDRKSPTIDTRKFTEYGILKISEYTDMYIVDNPCPGFPNTPFEEVLVNPTSIIRGFYKPTKGTFGVIECKFLSEIIPYIRETFKDVTEIRVGIINLNIYRYITSKDEGYTDERVVHGLGNDFSYDKIKALVNTPYIIMGNAQWAHDIPYGDSNIYLQQYTKLPNLKTEDPHPYFNNSSLCYFYNKEEVGIPKDYTEYVMSKFDDSAKFPEDGKPMSGYGITVMRISKPEPSIEKLKQIHRDAYTDRRLGMNAVINLNALMNRKFLDAFMMEEHPPINTYRVTDMNPVTTFKSNGEVLCQDTYRIIRKLDGEERIDELRQLLDDVLNGSKDIETIDITDIIFKKNIAKGKIEIDKTLNGKKEIILPKEITKSITRRKLRLKIGYDIPIYRSLNKITDINTQVLLVLYDKTVSSDSSKFERYSVFIKTDSDVSIWSSVYSNNLFSFLT